MFFVAEKDRDWCLLLADELDSQIQRLLKNTPILVIPKEFIDVVAFFTVGGLALSYVMFMFSRTPPAFTPEQIEAMSSDQRTIELLSLAVKRQSASGWTYPFAMLIVAALYVAIGLRPIARILEKVSRSVFYWEDMAPIHDQFERKIFRLKWGVGIAFVVSLAASVAGALLLKG